MRYYKEVFAFLTRKERIYLGGLLFLMVLVAAIELIGVGAAEASCIPGRSGMICTDIPIDWGPR